LFQRFGDPDHMILRGYASIYAGFCLKIKKAASSGTD
jgi:hypothetical protein